MNFYFGLRFELTITFGIKVVRELGKKWKPLAKANKNKLKRPDKELGELSVAYQSTNVVVKHLSNRHDTLLGVNGGDEQKV